MSELEDSGWVRAGVAAALAREYAGEGKAFVRSLYGILERALPEVTEPVLHGGFLSKKQVVGVTVGLGEFRYTLQEGHHALEATRTHVVRGIALKTEPMRVEAWIREVGDLIEEQARQNARAREALAAWMGG